jgi:DNA topoisomerase-2
MATQKYAKKTHLEHILDRPDTYVGSCEPVQEEQWVLNADKARMVQKKIEFVPGLFKIFDELLNNAIDQSVLDVSLDAIKVNVSPSDGSIAVYNTGTGIPVELWTSSEGPTDIYVPELIFGHLLTSSNYDDTEERITGGRNGYGAKLSNIFSTRFELEVLDIKRGLIYKQTFEDNMTKAHRPVIKVSPKSAKKGYVKVTMKPDLARFHMDALSGDILDLFEKRTYDCAACTRATVGVWYNDTKVPVKTFDKYVDLFLGGNSKEVSRVYEKVNERWEVCAARSADGFQQVSFVNGIATVKGGSHVTHVLGHVIDRLKAGNKKAADVRPYDLKERLFLFVNCTLVNPTFTSQTKEECASKVASFGSKCDLSDAFASKLAKLGIVEDALDKTNTRVLAKTDGSKRNTVQVPKLEDASKAGTAESHKCTLVLTEGDSAKTFAISGLSEVDRTYWGVFPLKGKMLNVRDASAKQVCDNQEISSLKTILGLQHGKEYGDLKSLRYGRVMILADADNDGNHIKGLVLNMFHAFWPSLVKLNFVCTMNTPVVKVFQGQKVVRAFFTVAEYRQWKESASTDLKGLRIKYYKGLGTSTAQEAKEYFKIVHDSTVTFFEDDQCNDAMELAFRKTLANKRKEWVTGKSPEESSIDAKKSKTVPVSSFVHKDLVLFSMEDVVRSIPSMVDGLKPSQRKVLYACLKRNLRQEIRVSQLAGYVSEVTSYHHGETSLCGTIVGMAQDYTGSNNVHLLSPIGQFGTRLAGGKDASSPRYIFTRLEPCVASIFDARDEPLLELLDDDGTPIEPKTFLPVLPMALVNGAEGIGTGYSTSVPCYDPRVLTENIRRVLSGQSLVPMHPWYRGFKGTIVPRGDASPGTYDVRGVYAWTAKNKIEVTELPIGVWTNDYKESIESSPWVKSLENFSTEKDIRIVLRIEDDAIERIKENPWKELGLQKTLNTGNMHMFDPSGKIRKYGSPEDILIEFCEYRKGLYAERKKILLQSLADRAKDLSTRIRFIRLVIDGTLVVFKRKTEAVLADMKALGLDDPRLLDMSVSNFTADKIAELEKRLEADQRTAADLERTTETELWHADLDSAQKFFCGPVVSRYV